MTRTGGARQVDVVTVVFNEELPLLCVQAKSIARFMGAKLGKYIVYVNESDPSFCAEFLDKHLRAVLGALAERLVVRSVHMIGAGPSDDAWLSQQACKLAAAEHCSSEFFLVLDSKHHLIRELRDSDLFDEVGHAHKAMSVQPKEHQGWLKDSLKYFGVPLHLATEPSPASAPPFVMHSETTRRMCQEIISREKTDLVSFFATKADKSTEFTLYYAYLLGLGLDKTLLVPGPNGGYRSLRTTSKPDTIEKARRSIASGATWCFSVHRRHFVDMPEPDRAFIAQVWRDSGLFVDDVEDAIRELESHFRACSEAERLRVRFARGRRARIPATELAQKS